MASPSKSGLSRARQQALATAALIIGLWVAVDQLFRRSPEPDPSAGLISPKLLVDIAKADESELRLLPHVGTKTARQWLEHRNEESFRPPNDLNDLEELPQVGPKRATTLAPFLFDP